MNKGKPTPASGGVLRRSKTGAGPSVSAADAVGGSKHTIDDLHKQSPKSRPPRSGEKEPSQLARLGIVPIINCGSMRSFYGNTKVLPEVVEAMVETAQAHIIMDELRQAVSRRLSELTGFEAGLVTSGSAAALFLSAAACAAGNNPEKMLRLPSANLARNTVLMPAGHRFSYDQAFRLAGLKIAEVSSLEDAGSVLKKEATALACYFGFRDTLGPIPFDQLAQLCHEFQVPIVVDAASEFLTRPNHWRQRGADLVVYSSGKYMRGPQASGLLLGRQDLVEAAARNSAPMQSSGRCMKVGKDQMVGAVVAVEQWFAQNKVRAEIDRCMDYLTIIEKGLKEEPLLETRVLQDDRLVGSTTPSELERAIGSSTCKPAEGDTPGQPAKSPGR